ncbi:uncharacterized protein LOC108038773 [Drosophila rhopaloa]|uniref:Uncharacterized protein LOC108038773 n=1 Tax=Drosophila rhopaloa TaxID=1041015 RepID=A0A6P4DZG1_DRORH|nr:uncharacterized protein LOC108038773 [Drosophila rhopaloa]
MFLNGKALLLSFGLANILLASNPLYIFPHARTSMGSLGIALIIVASGVLLFGELMAAKKHRANIILFWLLATLVFMGSQIIEIQDTYHTSFLRYLYIILLTVMDVLTYRIYNEEVKAFTSNPEEIKNKNEVPQPAVPVDQNPPPYEVKALNVQIA